MVVFGDLFAEWLFGGLWRFISRVALWWFLVICSQSGSLVAFGDLLVEWLYGGFW